MAAAAGNHSYRSNGSSSQPSQRVPDADEQLVAEYEHAMKSMNCSNLPHLIFSRFSEWVTALSSPGFDTVCDYLVKLGFFGTLHDEYQSIKVEKMTPNDRARKLLEIVVQGGNDAHHLALFFVATARQSNDRMKNLVAVMRSEMQPNHDCHKHEEKNWRQDSKDEENLFPAGTPLNESCASAESSVLAVGRSPSVTPTTQPSDEHHPTPPTPTEAVARQLGDLHLQPQASAPKAITKKEEVTDECILACLETNAGSGMTAPEITRQLQRCPRGQGATSAIVTEVKRRLYELKKTKKVSQLPERSGHKPLWVLATG